MKRIIAHLDMDAFFAAIEERDHPRLRRLPIVVGADPKEGKGRGVVSTANYKAREYGILSALPISTAWRFSQKAKREGKPEAVFLPVDFHRYGEVSDRIMEIIREYSSHVEQSSIDEAYLDLSFVKTYPKARAIAQKIKNEIRKKEKLTASIGIGSNKLIAKIASDFKKPDGLTVINEKEIEKLLAPLSVRKIPGIGPKAEQILAKISVKTIRNLRKLPRAKIHDLFGKWGNEMYERARGHDESPIEEEWETKSIGEQETFNQDTLNSSFVIGKLEKICKSVLKNLPREGFQKFRTVVVTIRFSDFETKSRSHTLAEPTNSLSKLKFEAIKLLMPFLDHRENPRRKLIRLVGVRVEKLEH
ncbi:MAG: DNA polymerase IV [Candidatus Moranbacteria bacterium]|nr:DNA polymerase IV [Candidatus Moranbacteria bacterium]